MAPPLADAVLDVNTASLELGYNRPKEVRKGVEKEYVWSHPHKQLDTATYSPPDIDRTTRRALIYSTPISKSGCIALKHNIAAKTVTPQM